MTISFSGLASGLDTSSWITSLTALKQAKVTVLQQEREELVVSKDTLSSIRSFFSSFRSVIERVTDTRFNIPALDLFAQNIAKSANLDVFTASATTEAEEGSYDITVKKLATKTKAISDYRYKTTITETTTATGDSYLKHIGITGIKEDLLFSLFYIQRKGRFSEIVAVDQGLVVAEDADLHTSIIRKKQVFPLTLR